MRYALINMSNWRKQTIVAAVDLFLCTFSIWCAFALRLEVWHFPSGQEWIIYIGAPLVAVLIFRHMGLHRAVFRYIDLREIFSIAKAVAIYAAVFMPMVIGLFFVSGVPRSLAILQPGIFFFLTAISRALAWQVLVEKSASVPHRLLIYGAGEAGTQIAAALAGARNYAMLGFIDDDVGKHGRNINGATVLSPRQTATAVDKLRITDILLALPSIDRRQRNRIISDLQYLPVRIRSMPRLADLSFGRASISDFQDLDLEDILGREPVSPTGENSSSSLRGKTILVTGAGGSIGSELCRQIAREGPAALLLVDHSEYALYGIHQELELWANRSGVAMQAVPLLASVCNFERILTICTLHRPSVIYHAAAYKHVPMVEANPSEGVVNNVLGTLNMARAAMECGVERFVLISTDKAVRPTNVMGASKRVAEQVLQALSAFDGDPFPQSANRMPRSEKRTCFSMVRFGNVLGSSGSVVPLFRRQIAEGGPLTVTHPDVTRYFMTIPEAVQLVLHAGGLANDGDLFVLDMGEPVKVLDLAKRMVAISGLMVRDDQRLDGDIEIRFTGLRPGEKLFEELLIGDNPLPTEHPRIVRAREMFIAWPELNGSLKGLLAAAANDDQGGMRHYLRLLVPGYGRAATSNSGVESKGQDGLLVPQDVCVAGLAE